MATMNMDCLIVSVLGVLLSLIGSVAGGSYCYDIGYGSFYCEYGCCGDTLDEYCCGPYDWIIGVAVVGSILVVGAIVFIVIFVCKKKQQRGRVIQPNTATVTTVTHVPPQQQQHQPYGPPPGYGQPMQPMGQPMPQPQQYPPPAPNNYMDPAYPPKY